MSNLAEKLISSEIISGFQVLANSQVDLMEKNAAKKVVESLRQNRFVIVKNHGISTNLLDDLYTKWGRFFNDERKLSLFRSDVEDEGYVPTNMETAVGNKVADMKEYYQTHWKGRYPDFIDCGSTKQLIDEFVNLGSKVMNFIDQVMPASAKVGMESSLSEMIKGSDRHGFRVIHYPPMQETKMPPRAGAHTDICFLTIIPTATAEGLEIQDSYGKWHNPHIEKSEVLVFTADMLKMATRGYIGAAMHRVVAGDESLRGQSRFSFPIFIHPRREVELEPGIKAIDALRKRITEIGFNGSLLKY